ncbi:MAG: hypothetical protein ACYTHM_15400, partial [Planctomycetota bacterium]
MKNLAFALVLCLSLFLSAALLADVLILKNGLRFEGKILKETEKGVKIKTSWGEAFVAKEHIERVIHGDVKIENPCPICDGTGKMACQTCSGKGQAPGACKECQGRGEISCKRCKGTGKRRCAECKGTGSRSVFVPGRGFTKGKCKKCGGHGFRYCSKCLRDAQKVPRGVEPCRRCKGQGTGDCEKCKTSGAISCVLCNGTGERRDSRVFFRSSYQALLSELRDPEKTELQRREYWENVAGKHVLWPGVVVDAGKSGGGYYVFLNLIPTDVVVRRGHDGLENLAFRGHLYAFVLPAEVPKVTGLRKGMKVWVVGELAETQTNHTKTVILTECEVFPESGKVP